VAADTLYFGHGDPWTGGAAAAVAHARELDAGADGLRRPASHGAAVDG
jgi:hypothetical protein